MTVNGIGPTAGGGAGGKGAGAGFGGAGVGGAGGACANALPARLQTNASRTA